jgi:diacylglycerol kinase family enzyme
MRALLVVNPAATTTTARGRDVLVRALRSEVDLRVEYTGHRGHAAELGREATRERYDVLVVLGGDGTVNEVVNGLLADGPGPEVPVLAVVPGGSTNVFARALDLPKEWAEATGVILEALREKRTRSIGLGQADGRYFTFCAGFGLDAEVVRRVEDARARGRVSTPGLYVRAALAQYAFGDDRKESLVTLERPGQRPEPGLALAIVQNTAPWTYLNDRELNACPEASFETGLDLLALRALGVGATTRAALQLFTGRRPHGKQVLLMHDLPEFTLRAPKPMAFQLDGDYLGEKDEVIFSAAPDALRVIY